MNFLDFLKQSNTDLTQPQLDRSTPSTPSTPSKLDFNLKRGDRVLVQRNPNGRPNPYKGYVGIVKFYKHGMKYALVVLEALDSGVPIKLPVDCLTKTDT